MIDVPKKLQIKAGMRVLVARPPHDFVLGPLPDRIEVSASGKGPFDLVLAFVGSRLDAEHVVPDVLKRLGAGGILWMCYPKKSSGVETDVTRDRGWEVLAKAGWHPVSQIAIDDIWSALRFKLDASPPKARGTRGAAKKPAAKKPAAKKPAAKKPAAKKPAAKKR